MAESSEATMISGVAPGSWRARFARNDTPPCWWIDLGGNTVLETPEEDSDLLTEEQAILIARAPDMVAEIEHLRAAYLAAGRLLNRWARCGDVARTGRWACDQTLVQETVEWLRTHDP